MAAIEFGHGPGRSLGGAMRDCLLSMKGWTVEVDTPDHVVTGEITHADDIGVRIAEDEETPPVTVRYHNAMVVTVL